jgi:hypothetical protein
MTKDLAERRFRALAVFVDLLPSEPQPVYSFPFPVGFCKRRAVADYLGRPMSGFHLPIIIFLDASGNPQGHYDLTDGFSRNIVSNSQQLVKSLLQIEVYEHGISSRDLAL